VQTRKGFDRGAPGAFRRPVSPERISAVAYTPLRSFVLAARSSEIVQGTSGAHAGAIASATRMLPARLNCEHAESLSVSRHFFAAWDRPASEPG